MSGNLAVVTDNSIEDLGSLKGKMPSYAKDIKLNLSSVLREDPASDLTMKQIGGIALASAYATRHADVINAIYGEFADQLDDADIEAAKAATTIMGMNNVYCRFVHMVSDDDFGKMPAGLRMNVIGNPGVEKVDFELYSLAVSAINGCGMCVDSHVQAIAKTGMSNTGIQHSIKIASVLSAAAQALVIS